MNEDAIQKDGSEPIPSIPLDGPSTVGIDKYVFAEKEIVLKLLAFFNNHEVTLRKSIKQGGVCLKPKAIDIFLNSKPLHDSDNVDPDDALEMLNNIQLAKMRLSSLLTV